ncbi:MAG: hypothetical protein ACJAXJ_003701, partial [Colwellia sp.]
RIQLHIFPNTINKKMRLDHDLLSILKLTS